MTPPQTWKARLAARWRRWRYGVLAMLVALLVAMMVRPIGRWFPVSEEESKRARELLALAERLSPLHAPLGEPGPSDWLASQNEPGQTFREYLRDGPTLPGEKRRTLYVLPLEGREAPPREILGEAAEFLGLYYGLPARLEETLPLGEVPAEARRKNPYTGQRQLLTTWLLDDVLEGELPVDAMALLAFVSTDLWPGEGWNFVFGMASLRERVGVWSLSRFGDPDAEGEERRAVLLRTLKLAVHETGHMFGMYHCRAYACRMNGSMTLEELDRSPLWLCPECHAKAIWAGGAEPVARYEGLAEFCDRHGLSAEADFYRRSAESVAARE